MTSSDNAHARETPPTDAVEPPNSLRRTPTSEDPDQLPLFPLDPHSAALVAHAADMAAMGLDAEPAEPETEDRLSPDDAALWLSRTREQQRALGKRHGSGLLAALFREAHGWAPSSRWVRVLVDRGDRLRVELGEKDSPELELQRTREDIAFGRAAARAAVDQALAAEKPMGAIAGVEALMGVVEQQAKLSGFYAPTKSAVKVEQTIEHRYEEDPATVQVRDLLAELVAEHRAQADPVKAVTGDITLSQNEDGSYG